MKTICVTGGAGFIGCNFIRYILKKYDEYKILCIDKLTYAGHLESLSDLKMNSRFEFIRADISDREKIFSIFEEENIDIVVNFAAESHVDRSIEEPEIFLQTNIMGTQVLVEAARKYGVERFHQVSTDEVYGDLPVEEKEMLFTEESPIKPSSPYSASKAASDLLVLAYERTYGLPATISRCSNNYGGYQYPEKLIPVIYQKGVNNEMIPVYGDGANIRDWLFVDDHCTAIDLILHRGAVGEVYNIGGHNEKSNLEIVKTILNMIGKSEQLIKFVPDRLGHDKRYAIDPSKMLQLGWKPAYDFEEGLRKTINWYMENQSWIENVSFHEEK